MLYRTFAIATLIAAPLLVLAVQTFLPKPPAPVDRPEPATEAPPSVPPPPVPVPVAPPVAPPNPSAISDAGRPMMTPGQGLPEAPPVPDAGSGYDPDTAPPGSPNAEK